jgi:hypothetical protein
MKSRVFGHESALEPFVPHDDHSMVFVSPLIGFTCSNPRISGSLGSTY